MFQSVLAILAMVYPGAFAAWSQPQPEHESAPEFEVASIKPANGTWLQLWPQRSGGKFSWRASLNQIILYAYHRQSWQVNGLPPRGVHFQLDAIADPAATTDEIRLMLQSLLIKRFNLATHYETREVVGYSLTVGKSGIKLTPAKAGDPPAPLPPWFAGNNGMIPQIEGKVITSMPDEGVVAVTGRGVSLAELADALQQPLETFVLDKTNVSGKYYFGIQFQRIDAPTDSEVPTLTEAIQSLGLRLEKEKGPIKALVIDRIEKMPTAN